MSPRAKQPPRRGRGRPPIDPQGHTVQLPTIAIGQRHFEELIALRADGRGKTFADVVRFLIEQSAARR